MNTQQELEPFTVTLNPASLQRSSSGQISGLLAVAVAGMVFPEPAWSDMVVTCMLGWTTAARSLRDGHMGAITLRFFDGPFAVVIEKRSSENVSIQCIDDRTLGREVPTFHSTIREVTDAIFKASRTIVVECRLRGWDSSDIRALATL